LNFAFYFAYPEIDQEHAEAHLHHQHLCIQAMIMDSPQQLLEFWGSQRQVDASTLLVGLSWTSSWEFAEVRMVSLHLLVKRKIETGTLNKAVPGYTSCLHTEAGPKVPRQSSPAKSTQDFLGLWRSAWGRMYGQVGK